MADAGLFIGWGEVVRGREERALEVFNSSVEYWSGLQGEGRIEGFDVAFLAPHGGDLQGFALLRGSEEQLDAVRRTDEFQRQLARVELIVDSLGVIDAVRGDGLGQALQIYQEEIGALA